MKTYDYIVIGGGSGGISTANRAADYGKRVLLVEEFDIGGTCVNRGCVPKKVLWNAAHIQDMFKTYAKGYGFSYDKPSLSFDLLKQKQAEYIVRARASYVRGMASRNVDTLVGHAKFLDPKTIEVNGQSYRGDYIAIATGARPRPASLPGGEFTSNSKDFFQWDQLPKKVAVIGGGYIGAELSSFLSTLDVETHLIVRKYRILDKFESYITDGLTEEMERSGVHFHFNVSPEKITKDQAGLRLHLDDGSSQVFDKIIWAAGIVANTEGMNLDQIGVRIDARGYIETDKAEETSQPGIFALGDVSGKIALTPVAIGAGRRLADRLFGGMQDRYLDYSHVPSVIFTHPPLATMGLSERGAIDAYGPDQVKVYKTSFIDMFTAITDHRIKNRMMLVCQGPEEKIVGIHLFGPGVDEMLQGYAVALTMGATKADFDRTIAIHPTSSEEAVTMR